MRPGAALALLTLAAQLAASAPAATEYGLTAQRVAEGVYVFSGRSEGFSRANGGNIVNTGFIVGATGVLVIDSGPSRAYGEQQRRAIGRVTGLPIERVFITHAHPDHFLGDQAYPAERLAALPSTREDIRRNGDALADNLYRLVGGAMQGTQAIVPTLPAAAGPLRLAGRNLRLIAASGHTEGDLLVYDETTRTLFSGDLVFFERAPTTPNADLPRWLAALDAIDHLDFATLVPGHGPVVHDHAAVAQTRDYLTWLRATLEDAAGRGLDMNEVMRLPLPPRFARLATVEVEFPRSVVHLYPQIELDALPALPALPAAR